MSLFLTIGVGIGNETLKLVFARKTEGLVKVQTNKVEKTSIQQCKVREMTQRGHELLSSGYHIFRKCILCPQVFFSELYMQR